MSKQRIKAEVGAMKVDALCKAISRIPCRNGIFNAREAFGNFIQHAFVSVVEANKKIREPIVLTDVAYRTLGFTPIDPSVPLPGYKEIDAAVVAYAEAVLSNLPFTDLLTPVHAYFLGSGSEGLGQHFTPRDLAKLASKLAGSHHERHGPDVVPFVMGDPCCGAGALLLATVQDRLFRHKEPSDWREVAPGDRTDVLSEGLKLWIQANDIDPLCSAMTTLQLLASQFLHLIALRRVDVQVGNALTDEKEQAFSSHARVALPGGMKALGTKISLRELRWDAVYRRVMAGPAQECTAAQGAAEEECA